MLKKLSRKVKMELVAAVIMTIALSTLTVYVNLPKDNSELGLGLSAESANREALQQTWGIGGTGIQQIISENIRGELMKDSFETVVKGLKNVTSFYDGRIPYLNMLYENEIWRGTLNCKVPTENVTSFTFDARRLISEHGKVTRISINVTETIVNQTQHAEEPLSDVSISLNENAGGGESPIISQLGAVVPWLVTSLIWIAQGLIIGLPLCFVSLGVVVLVEKGIVSAWKKQFKNRSLNKAPVEAEA